MLHCNASCMINYLGKFIPNLSELSAPLHELTCKNTERCWFKQHQDAFDDLKQKISSPPTLKYYDIQKPVTLTCNASPFGIGAECLQEGAPVAYASGHRRALCTYRKRTFCSCICMHQIQLLQICQTNSLWNRPPATSNYPQQAHLHSSSNTATHDAKIAEIQLHYHIQERETDVPANKLSHSPRACPNELYDPADFEVMSVQHISSRQKEKNTDETKNISLPSQNRHHNSLSKVRCHFPLSRPPLLSPNTSTLLQMKSENNAPQKQCNDPGHCIQAARWLP